MSAITIRKLPEGAKQRLRMRAAARGRSMEAEAREILLTALDADLNPDLSWIEQLITLGGELGGIELDIPEREPARAADLSDL